MCRQIGRHKPLAGLADDVVRLLAPTSGAPSPSRGSRERVSRPGRSDPRPSSLECGGRDTGAVPIPDDPVVTAATGVEPEWTDEPVWTGRLFADRARA